MSVDSRPWLKSYDKGVPTDIDVPNVTLRDWVEQFGNAFPDRPAFHFLGATWTYRTLMKAVDCVARALSAHGVGKGDVVSINLVNSPQFLIALYATIKTGAIFSPLSPLFSASEMANQLSDSGAKAIITLDYLFDERLCSIADQIPSVELVIVTGLLDLVEDNEVLSVPNRLPGKKVWGFRELLSRYSEPCSKSSAKAKVFPGDIAAIQYTGGTTGVPRGAVLTHRNFVANVLQHGAWFQTEAGREVTLTCFPMFHIGGLGHSLRSLRFSNTQILIHDPRDMKHIVSQAARYRPTQIGLVPTGYLLLMKEPGLRELDLSGLSMCVCGSAPFPVEKLKDFDAIFGPGKLLDGYGLTEASPLLVFNPKRGVKKAGSVGIPFPSTRLRFIDTESGEDVPQGEDGEIIACGPQIMKGYWNKPEETAAALREHNGEWWLHTGDVAHMDEDGFVFIVDRIKDMISVGGYKVFSSEVEHKLSESPAIDLCAIIGVPNPDRPADSVVKLVVQKSQSYRGVADDVIRKELIGFCRERMAPYKVPRIIEFVDVMPLTRVGKVDKKSLRKPGAIK